jgi:hypothetical protein
VLIEIKSHYHYQFKGCGGNVKKFVGQIGEIPEKSRPGKEVRKVGKERELAKSLLQIFGGIPTHVQDNGASDQSQDVYDHAKCIDPADPKRNAGHQVEEE